MSLATFATLVVRETREAILAKFLQTAQSVGLPVTTWAPGDPTDATFQGHTLVLDALEEVVSRWIRATFLDTAAADSALYDWLVWIAYQGFGYVARTASYATTQVTLSNAGGGDYPFAAGEVTFKSSVTGATYHNTAAFWLTPGPGTTATVDVEADEPGSASSAGIGEIDTLSTPLDGVTCTNAAAAIGLDAEAATNIVSGCRAKLAMMSPNGARDAYRYVAVTPALSGTSAVTMARSSGDSATGDVSVLVAGPNMPIGAPDLALVLDAFTRLCTPLCITPAVASATAKVVNVTYRAWGYASWGVTAAEAHDAIEAALQAWFAERPIGGDIEPPATSGTLYVNMIEAAIKGTRADKITRVEVTVPASAVALTYDEKPTCGTVTASSAFTFIPDP